MNLFIDTNIFFTFYNLSSESIEELKKALVLHEKRMLKLWLPNQVMDEFWRNRESVISQVISEFKKESQNGQIPQIARYSDKSDDLIENIKQYKKLKQEILSDVNGKVEERNLEADEAVAQIFESSTKIEISAELIGRARDRFDLGNPPGKEGSYGDAINWEALIGAIPTGEDLHIVTDDGDYFSKLSKDRPNEFLSREWSSKKEAKVYIYKRLSQYISANFPDAGNIVELEKNIAVETLEEAYSFQAAHEAIAALGGYSDFKQSQVLKIVEAYLTNSQVTWIVGDQDVKAFGELIIKDYSRHIEEEKLKEFRELIQGNT